MLKQGNRDHHRWWGQVITGILAIAFGFCAIAFPTGIMFGRILDVVFREANPFSGSMTAVAALLALVAWAGIDGLVQLSGNDTTNKRTRIIRGVVGVAVAIAAIVWPGQTAYIAVELIGLWAILVGVLELSIAKYSHENSKDHRFVIMSAIASILVGVGVMVWAFVGAVVICAMVGVVAIIRGASLVMSGFAERNQSDNKQAMAA